MIRKRLFTFLAAALAATTVALSGCDESHASVASSSDPALASGGLKSQGYRDSGGRWINAKKAPSNQTYYFAFDSNHVQSEDVDMMRLQAHYLATHPKAKIRLEGNTDNRGSREYNIALGWRRTQAVARMLESFSAERISPKQIEMVSYGKEHPAVFGNTETAWSLNRRVNLTYKVY